MKTQGTPVPPIPPGTSGADLIDAMNDRLRRVAMLAASASGQNAAASDAAQNVLSNASTPAASASGDVISFSMEGYLAIDSSAAPPFALFTQRTADSIMAVLNRAPKGGDVLVEILAGGKKWGAITIPDGAVKASVSAAALGPIPAGVPIVPAIRAIPTAESREPGGDLTVMIRLK